MSILYLRSTVGSCSDIIKGIQVPQPQMLKKTHREVLCDSGLHLTSVKDDSTENF